MMKLQRYIFSILCCLILLQTKAVAQFLNEINTGSVFAVRDPARQASTEIDAVLYNPAGTAFMKEGLNISLSGIFSLPQKADETAFFLEEEAGAAKNYVNRLNKFTLGPIQFGFKKGDWSVSGSFAYEDCSWDGEDGSGFFDDLLRDSSLMASNALLKDAHTTLLESKFFDLQEKVSTRLSDASLKEDRLVLLTRGLNADSKTGTARAGVTYRLNSFQNPISFHLGMKIDNILLGSSTGIKSDLMIYSAKNQTYMTKEAYWKELIERIKATGVQDGDNTLLAKCNEEAQKNSTTNFDIEEQADAANIYIVLGLDYRLRTMRSFLRVINFGAKYEFKPGRHPASCLSLGADYFLGKHWNVATGFTCFWRYYKLFHVSVFEELFDRRWEIPDTAPRVFQWTASVSGTYRPKDGALKVSGGITAGNTSMSINNGIYSMEGDSSRYLLKGSAGIAWQINSVCQLNAGGSCQTLFHPYTYTNYRNKETTIRVPIFYDKIYPKLCWTFAFGFVFNY